MTLLSDLKTWARNCDKPTLLFGVIILWNYFAMLPSFPQPVLYASICLYAVYTIRNSYSKRMSYVCFIVYLFMEVFITNPPALFNSFYRTIIFTLVLCCFSPMFSGEIIRKRRLILLDIILWFCLAIGVASFFGRFLGINYMRFGYEDFINAVGLFGGFTPHSMVLAPLASLGAIFSAYLALTLKKKWLWLLVVFCLGSILFAASRAALLAVIVGLVILILKVYNRFSKSVVVIASVGVILLATQSVWSPALEGVIKKNNDEAGTLDVSSRQSKWDTRLEEFESSPILGIGFCSVSLDHTNDYTSDGGIESGSSWLSVLSMTGLIGFIFVVVFAWQAVSNIVKKKDSKSALLLGILSFFFVHMLAEGYIFFGGSLLCQILWLVIACNTEYDVRC